jgi:hypothetical protein
MRLLEEAEQLRLETSQGTPVRYQRDSPPDPDGRQARPMPRHLARGTSDTIGHGNLADHRRRAHPAAASPREHDPRALAGPDDPAADWRLLRLLRADGPKGLVPRVTRGSPGGGNPPPLPAGWDERQRARRWAVPASPARPPRRAAARAGRAGLDDPRGVGFAGSVDEPRRADPA